ncbi:MAG TPA: hypothetical protein VJR06_09330, partial [Nitrososphaerales archaeon]|nr:hypothetical protein [Nitrososphaerales archaeon]
VVVSTVVVVVVVSTVVVVVVVEFVVLEEVVVVRLAGVVWTVDVSVDEVAEEDAASVCELVEDVETAADVVTAVVGRDTRCWSLAV